MEIERRIRWYQQPLHSYLVNGGRRALAIWHRRAGKDEIALAATCELGHRRIGSYWHCLPEYEQARKALWTAVNPHTGKRRIDEAFPPAIRETKDEQQMFIRLRCGSTWQLIGSDRYDATVGASPAGIVYSEWALANPSAWAYHKPMLRENKGWAAFITTPRGNNHAKRMLDSWSRRESHFTELLTVAQTGALTQEELDEELSDYIDLYGEDAGRAYFQQEYYCDFAVAVIGAYFGKELSAAEREGRVCDVLIDPLYPVHTAWDLGKAVNNPIWCFQVIAGQPRIVDFYRPESDDLEEWVKWLDDKGYNGTDYVPHDIIVQEWGTKRTRYETLKLLKRKPHRIAKVSVADGLQAARNTIKRAVFHGGADDRGTRMALGIDGLKNYRREWDDDLKTFRENPVKDWAEHIGSSFRYLGLAWKEFVTPPAEKPKPKDQLIYEVQPDGRVVANMSVKEIVEMKKRKRENA